MVETDTKELSAVEKAEQAAARLEAANKKAEDILARQIVEGKSQAGEPQQEKKEESATDYARRIEKGELTDEERAAKD